MICPQRNHKYSKTYRSLRYQVLYMAYRFCKLRRQRFSSSWAEGHSEPCPTDSLNDSSQTKLLGSWEMPRPPCPRPSVLALSPALSLLLILGSFRAVSASSPDVLFSPGQARFSTRHILLTISHSRRVLQIKIIELLFLSLLSLARSLIRVRYKNTVKVSSGFGL